MSMKIASRVQRLARKAAGGRLPAYTRNEANSIEHAGMIHSPVAGRTDRLPMGVKSGAYVIPADVVSAVGQGNSLAGANGFNKLLKMGPYGTELNGTPKISAPKIKGRKFADGGNVGDEPVEIVAAGGEFVIPPEKILEIGGGDISSGHDILDKMVLNIRKKNIKTLSKLPGPKKN